MPWFQGGTAEAVASSKAAFKPLLVLLKGRDADGEEAERNLLSQQNTEHMAGSVLLRLEDDLSNADPTAFTAAKQFRALCPTDALPMVAMVSPASGVLLVLKGTQLADAAALHTAIAGAFQQVRQQAQALMAAQAFAALAQHAQQQGQQPPARPPGQANDIMAEEHRDVALEDEVSMPELTDDPEFEARAVPAAPATAGQPVGPIPPSAASPQPLLAQPSQECHLHLRMPGGGTLACQLAGGAALREVFAAVDAHLASSQPPAMAVQEGYVLVASHPRREFGPAEEGNTLVELGVEPRSALVVEPKPAGHRPPRPLQAQQAAVDQASGAVTDGAEAGVGAIPMEEDTPAAPPSYTLQLRFTDSTAHKLEGLPATTIFAELFDAVDAHLAGQGRAPVPYLLVVPHPRRQFGPADAQRTLSEAGLEPGRISLAVVPNKNGHRPPSPPPAPVAPAPAPAAAAPSAIPSSSSAWPAVGGQAEPAAAAATADSGAAKAAPEAVCAPRVAAAPPTTSGGNSSIEGEVILQVRLTDGGKVTGRFDVATTTLSQVLDYVDARRTDGSRPYQVVNPRTKRTYYSGDISASLAALGLEPPRAYLNLDPLPPRPFAAPQEPVVAAPMPATFMLQFKQPDGGTLRGEFAPDATLQEVRHYIDTHRTDGGGRYALVQPYPKRRFGTATEELSQTLVQLGIDPRSALIMEGERQESGGDGLGWLGGLLSYINPASYWRPQYEANPQLGESMRQQPGQHEPNAAAASGVGEDKGNTRKRGFSGGASNVQTLKRAGSGSQGHDHGDGQNAYWNGNSTEFGGDDKRDG